MGGPPHILLPEKGSSFPSPGSSTFSPSETESTLTPSSISLPDSSSSSFAQRDPAYALAPMPALENQVRPEISIHHKKQDLPDGYITGAGLRKREAAESQPSQECTSKNSLRGSKRALMGSFKSRSVHFSKRKSCCRCVGAFAGDCAALSCCPCAIISLLAFMLVELPSALASRMIARVKKRLSVKDAEPNRGNKHGDEGHCMFTPTRSQKESCKAVGQAEAIHIIRFDTENLLKHFDAENVGFGCLSQKRE